jgi:DNA-binding HxlR family transcriptional regulator
MSPELGTSISTRASSIARALDEIGDKWSLLILQEVFLGVHSFNALRTNIGLSKAVLINRLTWLEQKCCIKKVINQQSPMRPKYHLTQKSVELYSVALMALNWEQKFFPTSSNQSIRLKHKSCGQEFLPICCCSACRNPIDSADVAYSPGPGAKQDSRPMKTRRRSSISIMDIPSGANVFKNLIHLVGDRWTANIIALSFHGICRYSQFHAELPVASNILTDRLEFLVNEGVFVQKIYQQSPRRYEYMLTLKGHALFPYFLTMLQWGDKWCGDGIDQKPMQLTHSRCFNLLTAVVVCSSCGQALAAHEVEFSLANEYKFKRD